MGAATMHDLLEELRLSAGCNYISDLHSPEFYRCVISAIAQIDDEEYDARAWNDVVRYITMQTNIFKTAAEAKHFLIDWFDAAGY